MAVHKERLKVLKAAVLKAGELVAKAEPADGVVAKEGRANLLTTADLASEKLIMDVIHGEFPDDEILAEETTPDVADPLNVKHLWVIDPIDGTNNFRYGRGYSAVSIGYAEKGIIQAAAVYNPFNKDLFLAQKGEGAFLNNRRIEVDTQSDLGQAVVATDNSSYAEGTRHNLELLLKLSETPWCLMRGSAVLAMCDVAAGRIDLYFHTSLKPWDSAAAFLIAEEAGAAVKGIDGKAVNFLSNHVVIGNKKLVNQFLGFIN